MKLGLWGRNGMGRGGKCVVVFGGVVCLGVVVCWGRGVVISVCVLVMVLGVAVGCGGHCWGLFGWLCWLGWLMW